MSNSVKELEDDGYKRYDNSQTHEQSGKVVLEFDPDDPGKVREKGTLNSFEYYERHKHNIDK